MIAVLATIAAVAAVLLAAGAPSHPVASRHHRRSGAGRTHVRASSSPHRAPSGPVHVDALTLTIDEPSAAAVATGDHDGESVRTLPTLVLYPSTATGSRSASSASRASATGPLPLIVFSQGYEQPVGAYRGLLDAWARAGYVVAAPTYPRTATPTPAGLDEADILNHPADLRFLITTLTADARAVNGPLAGLIDPSEIALAGQSDGGDVALAAAANTCCRIPTVKAAVILSGAELSGFGGAYYGSGSVPLLVAQGDRDSINLPGCSAALYDGAPAPKYYLDLLGAAHLPPYEQPGRARSYVARAVVAFLDDYLKHDPLPWQGLVNSGGMAGVASLVHPATLPGRSTYCP